VETDGSPHSHRRQLFRLALAPLLPLPVRFGVVWMGVVWMGVVWMGVV
jgi:hypothetical protein